MLWQTPINVLRRRHAVSTSDYNSAENPAFNYGFFRPNPHFFAGIDQDTDHGRSFYLLQASQNKPESCCCVAFKETLSGFQPLAIRRQANLPLSNP